MDNLTHKTFPIRTDLSFDEKKVHELIERINKVINMKRYNPRYAIYKAMNHSEKSNKELIISLLNSLEFPYKTELYEACHLHFDFDIINILMNQGYVDEVIKNTIFREPLRTKEDKAQFNNMVINGDMEAIKAFVDKYSEEIEAIRKAKTANKSAIGKAVFGRGDLVKCVIKDFNVYNVPISKQEEPKLLIKDFRPAYLSMQNDVPIISQAIAVNNPVYLKENDVDMVMFHRFNVLFIMTDNNLSIAIDSRKNKDDKQNVCTINFNADTIVEKKQFFIRLIKKSFDKWDIMEFDYFLDSVGIGKNDGANLRKLFADFRDNNLPKLKYTIKDEYKILSDIADNKLSAEEIMNIYKFSIPYLYRMYIDVMNSGLGINDEHNSYWQQIFNNKSSFSK